MGISNAGQIVGSYDIFPVIVPVPTPEPGAIALTFPVLLAMAGYVGRVRAAR